ncbi:hypothetical protein [Streptomyces sp. NPDC046985]|uniref:hypothetical protein n=1 Tax=Streptomyces sp. NPDC046985 TaxID=3155377 RepID=UPI0033C04DE5
MAVEESPDDPDARSRLRERLLEALSEDPAFAADLARVLLPPKPTYAPTFTHSINVDRGSRARGTFVTADVVPASVLVGVLLGRVPGSRRLPDRLDLG